MKWVALMFWLFAVVISIGVRADGARAQGDEGPTPTPVPTTEASGPSTFPGVDTSGESDSGRDVDRPAEREETVPPAVPVVLALDVDGDSEPSAEIDGGDGESDGDASAGDGRVCVEPRAYVDDSGTLVPYCAAWQLCAAERVDDVVSGEINNEPPGHYARFLNETVGYLDDGTFTDVAGFENVSSVNELLNANGLTDPERRDDIAVFNFCASVDSDGDVVSYDFTSISFDWTLGSVDVYDVDGIRRDLYEKLVARLRLEDPQIGAVPDTNVTLVQWPTWLYLRNLLAEEAVYTTNDTDTFRVDLRAQLLRLEWFHDGRRIATCEAGEVKVWDPDKHDPIEHLPDCHHVFTQRATGDLIVQIVYLIQEDVRTAASSGAYLPLEWADYFGVETVVDLDASLPDYRVCEVYSVNVTADFEQASVQEAYDRTACVSP